MILLLLAGLCLLDAVCAAQSKLIDIESLSRPRMDTFDAGDGLPNLTLVSVSATPDGHVWAGTMRGLARYNGLRFVPVELPGDAGSPGMVSSVLAIDNQQIWAAPANRGVYLWNGRQWRHFRPGQEFPGHDVRRLRAFNTRDGLRIFATTNEGLIAVWDGTRWAELNIGYRLRGKEIFDILLLPGRDAQQDVYWVATYNAGLIRCQAGAACIESRVPGEQRFYEISSLRSVRERDGSISIWAGSYGGGVARLNRGRWQRFSAEDGLLNGDYVHDLEVVQTGDPEPEIWVGTRNGFSSYRAGQWRRYDAEDPLLKSRVRGLTTSRDDDGRPQLWAATDNGAVRLHLRGAWRTVRRLSEYGNGVWAVRFEAADDGVERLWLGSDGDGLWRFERGQWTQYGAEQGLPSNVVRSITRLRNGPLWLGFWDGHVAEQAGERFRTIETPWPKDPQQAVNTFLNDSKGGVWVGLRKGGVAYHDGRQWRYYDAKSTGAPEYVLGMGETGSVDDPVIWASSKGNGLGRFYRRQWRRFTTWNSELPDDDLINLQVIPDARNNPVLWMGTRSHGLIRMDISNINRPRLITSPALPPPPHPYVYGAVQNSRGDLVICTDYGAAYWLKTGTDRYRAINYHRNNGLPHDECNAGSLGFDRHDRAWIGTIGGAAVLTPVIGPSRLAPLSLERLRLGDRDQQLVNGKREFSAPNTNAGVDIEFALLTGERESESLYRTQLIGLDDGPGPWLQSNQRSFSKVPSGEYVLKVEAKDFTGAAARPLEIRISIPTPWWRSWWAIALMALLVAGALGVIVSLRERRLRARESQLLNLVDKRTGQLERRGKELHRINEELRRLSYRDTLTGVANRRKLLETLDGAWQQAQRENTCLAFILLDVDDFKAINDTYGHIHGDGCLRSIARQLEVSLHDSDCTLGRYGGEEFGIVLPDTSMAQAAEVAEKCCQDIEQLQLPHESSMYGIVTLSLGVACIWPKPGESSDILISKADAALYLAKQNGKNRVELADQEPS
ncbi:MAG: diguanylate cyclase [Arenimonas sp.]|nr:diguanylate cyclase [Arenimonas sp.]